RSRAGAKPIVSIIESRTLPTPVCEAASISCTSMDRLSEISLHEGQAVGSSVRQGVGVGTGDLWQFKALASKRAVVVFPTTRAPGYRCSVPGLAGFTGTTLCGARSLITFQYFRLPIADCRLLICCDPRKYFNS